VPFGAWFRGPLSSVLRRTLAADAVRAGGVFDPLAVSALVAEHVSGRRDHARILWSILTLELWRRAQRL
jgi:asparagine synthase (glutamine-hydrolysing)